YISALKPHAVRRVYKGSASNSVLPDNIPTETQEITYTPYHQPATITEGNYELTYTYGPDYQRKIMHLENTPENINISKIYAGDVELLYENSILPTRISYVSSPAGLIGMYVYHATGNDEMYYTYTDHLGSIVTVTDDAGDIVAEQSFDAWGNYRNPSNWLNINVPANPSWLYRGYTGHEHLPEFGLINMNGRMYDPIVGRMLSPDNYVQSPFSTQSYNRYSYVWNNPLKYTDPDGQFVQYIIGAVIGGVVGTISGHAAGLRGWKLFGYAMASAGIGAATAG